MMLSIGSQLPSFNLKGVLDSESLNFPEYNLESNKGKWSIYIFYPKDFTFICPTELTGYDDLYNEFTQANTNIYGVSTDSEFVHRAWRKDHDGIGKLRYPLLSDVRRDFSRALGVVHATEGVCLRATYIVDDNNIIRHVSANDLPVGRSAAETLRILKAFQAGGLMACDWQPGDKTLQAS